MQPSWTNERRCTTPTLNIERNIKRVLIHSEAFVYFLSCVRPCFSCCEKGHSSATTQHSTLSCFHFWERQTIGRFSSTSPAPPSTSLWMYQLRMIYTQRIFQKQYYYHITYAYCMCNCSSPSWVSVSTAKQNFNCFLSCFPGVDAACHEKKAIEKEVGTLWVSYFQR